jgi:hypothetical protein
MCAPAARRSALNTEPRASGGGSTPRTSANWLVNPAELGVAWKANGAGNRVRFKSSANRQYGRSPGQEIGPASNTVGTRKGVGIKTSAFRHLT